MVDEYGNPLDLWEVYAEFADKVGPLGELIAGAPVVEHHGLEADAPTITLKTLNNVGIKGPRQRPAIYLGALRPQGMGALLVFAVNIDRENPHEVELTGSAAALAGRRLYDLVSLKPVEGKNGRFRWGPLAPGDGHPFALATEQEFAQIRQSALATRAGQALRVAGLDVRKAERWGIDVASLRRDMEEAEQTLSDDPAGALEAAQSVGHRARSALRAHSVYSDAAPLIKRAQEKLGQIEILLNLAVLKEQPVTNVKPVAERVLELSEKFSKLKGDLYFGRGDGLTEAAGELLPQVEQALARVKEVTGLTVPDPIYPEHPWNHPELFE